MAAFQSTLTDFSSAYRPATGLYFGAPIWQLTATGSGSSSSVVAAFATKAKQGTGSGVGSAAAVGVRIVGRTATGSAIGVHVAVISGPTQLRLGAVTDFSFPYLTGGRFYLGPAYYLRTASASGTGSQSTVSLSFDPQLDLVLPVHQQAQILKYSLGLQLDLELHLAKPTRSYS